MIINSLLDTDFYKMTMGKFAYELYPEYDVEYDFKCRSKGVLFTKEMVEEIEYEISHYTTNVLSLGLTEQEQKWLQNILPFDPKMFEELHKKVSFHVTNGTEGLKIKIKGKWYSAIHFEVPVLAIVNEVYFKRNTLNIHIAYAKLREKINIANACGMRFAEFGTRRRFSHSWQAIVLRELKNEAKGLLGTSNCHFAQTMGLQPVGTMAHELVCFGQELVRGKEELSQQFILNKWLDFYNGKHVIALTDTLTTNKFIADFDRTLAERYTGIRHDSGDPYEWTEKVIRMYKNLQIDIKDKTICYSDGLDFPAAKKLHMTYKDKFNVIFGIGTNLTNDVGVEPLSIVMKMTAVNGRPVAKISDNPDKAMCNDDLYLKRLKSLVGV